MTRTPADWRTKYLRAPEGHASVIGKAMAGVPAGGRLWISSPREVEAWLRSALPLGRSATPAQMRAALAERHGCDGCCAITAGIFLRVVSECAWDELLTGAAPSAVAPFWRVVEPRAPLAGKLRCGPDWLRAQRAAEGL